jgi:hypothetical protein
MDGIMGGLQGAVKVGLDTIKGGWDTFTGALQSGVGTLQSALDSAGGTVEATLNAVGDATAPATSTVTDAFTGAFTTISTAATNFWNWLTGHSLWPDMLNLMGGQTRDRLLDIASTFNKAFASINQDLSAHFRSMSEGTKGAMGMILQVIAGSLTEIRNNFMSTIRDVEASWSDAWTEINRVAATTTQQIFAGLTIWWPMLQANFMTGLTAITGAWQTSWTSILDTAANICGQIMGGLTAWWKIIQDATTQNLALLTGNFQNALSGIYGMFTSTFSGMASAAQWYMSSIAASVANAFAQVQAAAAQMKAQMVTGSIWPDMLAEMEKQTHTSLGNIVGDFQGAFSDVSLAVPSYPAATRPERSASAFTPSASAPIRIELTNNTPVVVDGRVLYRIIEKRLVNAIEARHTCGSF